MNLFNRLDTENDVYAVFIATAMTAGTMQSRMPQLPKAMRIHPYCRKQMQPRIIYRARTIVLPLERPTSIGQPLACHLVCEQAAVSPSEYVYACCTEGMPMPSRRIAIDNGVPPIKRLSNRPWAGR